VVIAMPLVCILMESIRRYYDHIAAELRPGDAVALPGRCMRSSWCPSSTPGAAGACVQGVTRPNTLTAVTVRTSDEEVQALEREWSERDIPMP
jgi:hypothetical protein